MRSLRLSWFTLSRWRILCRSARVWRGNGDTSCWSAADPSISVVTGLSSFEVVDGESLCRQCQVEVFNGAVPGLYPELQA